jgi:hypothetical protein
VIAPSEIMPNIVATFEGGKPGRHLALNGRRLPGGRWGWLDARPVGRRTRRWPHLRAWCL